MARAISVLITGSAASLRKAIREATDALGSMGAASTLAFSAAATATTMFAQNAIKAAADDQKQQALLARQLQITTGASRSQIAAVEAYIDATQRSIAVSDNELRPALQTLSVATKDLGSAQELLNLSLDISAATGRSVSDVATALSRGYAGNTRGLQTLSPELKKAIKDGADFSDVLEILRQNFAGAAGEASQTMAGRLAILRNSVDEAKEAIGAALLPSLERLVPALVNVANLAGRNSAILGTAAIVVGTFTGAIVAARGAIAAWRTIAAVTTAINTALGLSFSAIQVATGVGIVTALAAIPVYLRLKNTFSNLTKGVGDYNAALGATITTQKQLNDYMGPVPSRNLAEFQNYYSGIAGTGPAVNSAIKATNERLKNLQSRLTSAKASIRAYVAAIASQITSTVSLSSAYSQATASQTDATNTLNSALEDRRRAYEALNQAQQTNDVQAYNAALTKVGETEAAVTAAQAVKPKSYLEVFREQITAAKEFSGNLKALIAAGLGKAGLQQILDLGPVAGNAVAKDLLAGTGGYTVGSLNADLSAIAREATSVGMSIPGVSTALTATAGKAGTTYQITVNAGVGDKVAIGRQVVDVLQAYEKQLGGIPIKVK